ncbi:MAG: helix-turn-helix transcriptional regulator [Polyangiaceae bacterium]|nr:helix-turn-helix transcriptional regulator [Polyangiaceae bacterium]
MIGEGLADIATLARRLGVSPRTLQRKLEAEGVAYSELLDQARRELACAYLADPALSVEEIAALTGYSEASAFSRAFRRWTGASPLRYRRGRA